VRGSKAKAIRRKVYGDMSLREPRRYTRLHNQRDKKHGGFVPGSILNLPDTLRAVYQRVKHSTLKGVAA